MLCYAQMRLVIQPDEETVGSWLAEYVISRIEAFRPTAERPFVLGVATGKTLVRTFECVPAFFSPASSCCGHCTAIPCLTFLRSPPRSSGRGQRGSPPRHGAAADAAWPGCWWERTARVVSPSRTL